MAPSHWGGLMALLCSTELSGHRAGCARGRSLDTGTQLVMELDRRPWQDRQDRQDRQDKQDRQDRQDRSPSRSRRESLESLGARISRLSQSHVGVSWGVPWASPSAQPALGYRDSPHGDLVVTDLPEHSWRTPGISAGRSKAGTSTGSSFPRATHARTRGHPALDMRRQEPPALWRRGGNVTFPMDDTDRTQAADSSRSAGTAVRAPGHWGSPVSPGLRGDQKGGLLCKGVPPRWRSQQGTRELGSAAKPWSQGDRARTGLALLGHAWDTHHWCHKDLQSTSWQGACVGQERLDKERRRTATSLKQKLELLERLRELERGSRSLLQQRLRVMQQLRGLLQRDEAETLRQLQEALEQDGEQRQQTEKTSAPGAPGEPLSQGQREHPHPSPSLSSTPGLCQRARGSLGLLHHLQELQLDKTQNSGTPGGTTGHEEQRGGTGTARGGDPPSTTALALIQGEEEGQSSSMEHNSCWERPCSGAVTSGRSHHRQSVPWPQ
ncbi:uncharacterized protein LOC117004896 isoform X2 [Catharus ustulatus]|uniref:uncharacterized protein LOC117004896 isoform X2 n=1 Tax=Catharus ustulatus TaxID=91951 RepID=UPI00140CE69C|nr:uncharacterized protein LOC117004896 isoform X2 [Catharus ustulatus]